MASMPDVTREAKERVTEQQRERFKKQFYSPQLPPRFDAARRILEQYSNIPAGQINDHVLKIRDQGWAVMPFPCIGQFRFLELERTISDPNYQFVLARLRRQASTDTLLDVGCFVGQALRALAFDGVDPKRLYGTDLEQAYLDLGYELFRDRDKIEPSHLIAGDMLQEPRDTRLDAFVGRMTYIHASSFFHLFSWPLQVRAAKRCIEFLQPDSKDAMIFGGMVGRDNAGELPGPGGSKLFMHNAQSWEKLWDEVGETTGTTWATDYQFVEDAAFEKDNPQYAKVGVRRVRFAVRRTTQV